MTTLSSADLLARTADLLTRKGNMLAEALSDESSVMRRGRQTNVLAARNDDNDEGGKQACWLFVVAAVCSQPCAAATAAG